MRRRYRSAQSVADQPVAINGVSARDGVTLSNTNTKQWHSKLKDVCEKCNTTLVSTGIAYICSHECTYCEARGLAEFSLP
jgi:hypothetical protein